MTTWRYWQQPAASGSSTQPSATSPPATRSEQLLAAGGLTSHETSCRLDELVDREAETLVYVRERRRRAEMVDADDDPLAADPSVPGHRMRRLDRHPLGSGRQHLALVLERLSSKQLVTWHA